MPPLWSWPAVAHTKLASRHRATKLVFRPIRVSRARRVGPWIPVPAWVARAYPRSPSVVQSGCIRAAPPWSGRADGAASHSQLDITELLASLGRIPLCSLHFVPPPLRFPVRLDFRFRRSVGIRCVLTSKTPKLPKKPWQFQFLGRNSVCSDYTQIFIEEFLKTVSIPDILKMEAVANYAPIHLIQQSSRR